MGFWIPVFQYFLSTAVSLMETYRIDQDDRYTPLLTFWEEAGERDYSF